ncbi:MAG TPA: malonyl CoA-acyl carrier protein transacylase, partial [Rhodobacteraceae bacterium]|nr:malonyl CoA-acyl carrier protein transacylase [Paracoccaceae bacterium]
AIALAKEAGAKRALLLPVSAPFHCDLMAPAAAEMAQALSTVAITAPKVPLVCNVKAEAVSAPEQIRELLFQQITASVRWRESVQWMIERKVSEIWEIGAGKALTGMVRRIDRAVACRNIATPDNISVAINT